VNAQVDARYGDDTCEPQHRQRKRGARRAIGPATANAVIAWPEGNDGEVGTPTSVSSPISRGGRLLSTNCFATAFSPDVAVGYRGQRRAPEAALLALRRAGVRVGRGGPRAPGTHGLAALSPREREVTELVADGLTNRQIKSPRTSPPATAIRHSPIPCRARRSAGR
jgi:hypothetical protein